MSEKPMRPWFRFHLLTAVLVMVAAAILVIPIVAVLMMPDQWREFDDNGSFNDPFPAAYIVSALIALGLIASIGVGVEYIIRRREGRKA